jgi:hypothetical protein
MSNRIREIVEACMKKDPTKVKKGIEKALSEKVYERLQEKKSEISACLISNNQ